MSDSDKRVTVGMGEGGDGGGGIECAAEEEEQVAISAPAIAPPVHARKVKAVGAACVRRAPASVQPAVEQNADDVPLNRPPNPMSYVSFSFAPST